MIRILFLVPMAWLCGLSALHAQVTFFNSEPTHIGANANISVFGNVTVKGALSSAQGNGTQPVINFKGTSWTNDTALANLQANPSTDTGAVYVFNGAALQTINGGSKSATDINSYFPNLEIANNANVQLQTKHEGCSGALVLSSGKLILNQNNFTNGIATKAGSIIGYTENSFVVTNGSSSADTAGFLIRKLVAANVDYPIGPSVNSYDPARLQLTSGSPQLMKVRVFSGASTTGFGTNDVANESCGVTWDLIPTAASPTVTLTLDHEVANEGAQYVTNRGFGYITHFTGGAPNVNGGGLSNTPWDLITSGASGTSGTISTGAAMSTHAEHTRSGISSFSPFSKTFNNQNTPLPLQLIYFNANKQEEHVSLVWAVEGNKDVKAYCIERTENADFTTYVTLATIANTNQTTYTTNDNKPGNGIYYYRLKLLMNDGTFQYSKIRAVQWNEGVPTNNSFKLWPNPISASQVLNLSFDPINEQLYLLVYASNGQVIAVHEIAANESSIQINCAGLASGKYMLQLLSAATKRSIAIQTVEVQ